jgi:hypothetical protein
MQGLTGDNSSLHDVPPPARAMAPVTLLLLLSSIPAVAPAASGLVESADPVGAVAPAQDEFNDKMKAAGDDPKLLWELYGWTQEDKKREKYAKRVLLKLVKLEPDHAEARAALGHIRYEDQWFESDKELEAHKKKRAKELGLVDWKGEWVEPADLPFLRKGLIKDRLGRWIDPEVQKKLDEGWVQQDLVWVAPDDKGKIAEGLWKCGDKWLSLADADEFHSYLGAPWIIPEGKAIVWSFAPRAIASKALEIVNKAYFDVSKATGVTSELQVPFALARDQEQFLKLCDGDESFDHPLLEPRALSSQMRAAFLDLWFDFDAGVYRGMGATFWDPAVEHADNYAIHDVRMAYGLSWMEAIDPATKAIDEVLADKQKRVEQRFALDRINGRKLPEWIHWGVASYASRWFVDTSVGQGGNPQWAPQWSAENIKNKGGLDPLGTILDCQLRADDENASKLVNEVGLLVAFCVDGKNVEASQAWNAVFTALKGGGDVESSLTALRKFLLQSESAIRAFAKL